ncbi:MAG: response regulator, partial [Nitrosopumilus sp.]
MLQPKIILVVDDDKDILQLYSILLTRAGYSVDTAENGADAIEKTKTRRFDLALVDIVLPDMQGTDLLTKINGMNSKMRKIMVTGNATLDNAILALNLGADAYLRKPVKTEVLLESIEAQLRIQREEMLMTQEKISEFIQGKKANFVDIVR